MLYGGAWLQPSACWIHPDALQWIRSEVFMRRGRMDPSPDKSASETDCDLEDILTEIVFRNKNMMFLSGVANDYRGDKRLGFIYRQYGILESYQFIVAVEKLLRLTEGVEKTKIIAVMPLISWLQNYKPGLRQWRNKRAAHLDLSASSMTYYIKYKIPITDDDFNIMTRLIFFLHEYITDTYMPRILEISKESNIAQQNELAVGFKIARNHDLGKFKEQTIKNLDLIYNLFQNDKYHRHVMRLWRL